MSDDVASPIVIDPSSLPGQIAALARYLVTAGGAYALGKGWIDNELLTLLTGLVTVAGPAIYSMWRVAANKRQAVALAQAAPDSVAVVKS